MLRLADWGATAEELELFNRATIVWSDPIEWKVGETKPNLREDLRDQGGLYAFVRNHHNQKHKDVIAYIGMTNKFSDRLNWKHKQYELVKRRGKTEISLGIPTYRGIRVNDDNRRAVHEHLEHLFMWAVWSDLYNQRNMQTLPGTGASFAPQLIPWEIFNRGYRFKGRMPRQIIYPWMAVQLGQGRSLKRPTLTLSDGEDPVSGEKELSTLED